MDIHQSAFLKEATDVGGAMFSAANNEENKAGDHCGTYDCYNYYFNRFDPDNCYNNFDDCYDDYDYYYNFDCTDYYGYDHDYCDNGGAGGWVALIVVLFLIGIGLAVFLVVRHQKRRKAGLTGGSTTEGGSSDAVNPDNLDDTEASLNVDIIPKIVKVAKQKTAPISTF